jgi:hypothetical protein
MAIIEFRNIETETAFLNSLEKEQIEITETERQQQKLKRILYLKKHGLTHPDIVTIRNIDLRAQRGYY